MTTVTPLTAPDLLPLARAAEQRIRPYIRETYLERSVALSSAFDADVYCKLENLQHTGSFKARGAMNKVLSLSEEERSAGIVAASTGNHGAAAARSAGVVGVPCHVFVPAGVDPSKLANIRRHGATIEEHGADPADAERFARRYAAERGRTYVSPYNDPAVVAGQGTVGVELARQLDGIDTVFVALGGGGLAVGIAGVLKGLGMTPRIVACSPEHSAVMAASVRAGRILDLPSRPTLSDGTAGGVEENAITFDLCRELIDDYVTVSEDEIAVALRHFIEGHHLLIEGAAAVAVAGLQQLHSDIAGHTIVVIICGGNIGLDTLRDVL
jgi:threonine dehydratase